VVLGSTSPARLTWEVLIKYHKLRLEFSRGRGGKKRQTALGVKKNSNGGSAEFLLKKRRRRGARGGGGVSEKDHARGSGRLARYGEAEGVPGGGKRGGSISGKGNNSPSGII